MKARSQTERGESETKRDFLLLRAKGLSLSSIADQLHVSKATLVSWGKEFGGEIAHLKAIELEALYKLEALYEKACLLKVGRIQALHDELAKWLSVYAETKGEHVEPISCSPEDEIDPNLAAQQIRQELDSVLRRYRGRVLDVIRTVTGHP